MSRRARAGLFLLLALGCAGLAAALANGYGSSVARAFGPLRPVVVAVQPLPAGTQIGPRQLSESLRVRRVPARFIPPDAISEPEQALGRIPAAVLPAGSYLLSTQLRTRRPKRRRQPSLAEGRRAVEITVSGAEGLLAGGSERGARVDVVVTSEPRGPGPGRTYVAAAGVRLLALSRQRTEGPGPAGGWSATLALTRRQALALIEAESFARGVRLLQRPG